MGNHHEENVPQNPNKSEKTRFDFAPDSSADSEPIQEPIHQTEAVQTRFGMIPPTLAHTAPRTVKTGQFRFEGSPEAEVDFEADDSGLYKSQEKPVFSHAGKKRSRTGEVLSIFFFYLFRLTALLLLFAVLLGLGAYFVFYDSIYPSQAVKPDPSVSIPPTTVRFFDLVASGRRFVFLVDTTELMGGQADSSSFHLIRNQLQQSLRDLKEFDYFEIFDFPAVFDQDTVVAFVPADTFYLSIAREKIDNLQPEGTGDLRKTILEALALKPDTLFLLCHSANAEQLDEKVLEEIQAAAGDVKFYAVEISDSIKPLHETPLEKLTRTLQGDYQWLNILQKTSFPRELSGLQRENYENASIPPLTEMIEADFRFYDDVSRPETRRHSPFGKETVTGPNRSLENSNSLSSPKQLPLNDSVIHEIETDARIIYMSGLLGLPQNPPLLHVGAENRLALWLEGAKAELPAAEYLIGLCYKNGVRVRADENKAFQCQLKAALQGCQPAMFLAAMEYLAQSESGSTDPNAIAYMKYWVEKGAKLGEPLAQCYWANHFTDVLEERFSWLEKAANQDLPEAQHLLGKCFETGSGVIADKSVAAVWYEKAAKQGHTAAQIAWDMLKTGPEAGLE